tara:strand:+ start:22 stop:3825 length:3804 start_codon:yes stop_codon:yes gene_type:complete
MVEYHQQDANKLNKDYLVNNNDFLRDASQFLRERKDYSYSDLSSAEDIYSLFVSHMRDADVNELTAVNDLTHVNSANENRRAQIGKLYSTWDRMESGGTGFWNAVRDYGLGVATAPSTYIGLITGSAGKLFGAGAAAVAKETARKLAVGSLGDIIRAQTPKASAIKGAIGAGAVEGTAGGVRGAAAEQARVEADITGQREFDVGKVALEAGIGVGAGAVLGGAVGAVTGRRQMKALGLIERSSSAKAGRIAEAEAKIGQEVLQDVVIDAPSGDATKKISISADEQTEEFTKIFNHIRETGFGKEALDKGAVKAGLENFDKRLLSPVDPDQSFEESLQYRLAGVAVDILKTAMRTKGPDGEAILGKFELDFEKDRVTTVISKIINNIDDDTAKGEFISGLLEKYDLTLPQFTNLYVAELSNAGRILGLQSAVVKDITQAFAALEDVPVSVRKVDPTDPTKTINSVEEVTFTEDTKAFVRSMEKGAGSTSFFRKLTRGTVSGIKEWDKFTKGMMTIQPATTMRNLENATLRSFMYVATNVFEGALDAGAALIRKGMRPDDPEVQKAFSDGLLKIRKGPAFVRNLFDNSEAKAIAHLFHEDMPQEYSQLFRALADIEGATKKSSYGTDVGSGRLTQFARKANALNTFIDNSFKRAVFVSELASRVGGRKALLELSEQGRFNQIATKNIQDSLDEALDFTYQTRFTGKGKTEYGVFNANSAADMFVKAFSVPVVGSGFIPYPRFIASMIKHNFQYAPLVGMLPLERLGYRTQKALNYPAGLQKAIDAGKTLTQKQKTIKAKYDAKGKIAFGEGRSVNKIIAQQAVGFGLLYGSMQLRAAQGPYAEWFEMQKLPLPSPSSGVPGAQFRLQDVAKGRYTDARAFYGVYAPSMLVADLLLKSLGVWNKPVEGKTTAFDPSKLIANEENRQRMKIASKRALTDNLNSKFFRNFLESSFGSQFRVGQGLYLLDLIAGVVGAGDVADAKHQEYIADQVSTFIANYLVRPVVPFGFVKDVLGTIDPAFQVIPDRGDVNPFLMGAYGDAIRNAVGILTRPLPIKEGKVLGLDVFEIEGYDRPAVSPQTTRLLAAEGGAQKQIFGIGGGKYKNEIQKEISRLNIDKPWNLFKRYKAPMLKRISNKYSGQQVENQIISYIRTDNEYVNASKLDQEILLVEKLRDLREDIGEKMEQLILTDKEVNQDLDEEGKNQLLTEFYKIEFSAQFSSAEKRRIERAYKEGRVSIDGQKVPPTDLTKVKGTQARLYYKNAIDIMKSLRR